MENNLKYIHSWCMHVYIEAEEDVYLIVGLSHASKMKINDWIKDSKCLQYISLTICDFIFTHSCSVFFLLQKYTYIN